MIGKKKLKEDSFEYYLKKGNLATPYALNDKGGLAFHWANWDHTTEYIRAHATSNRSEGLENAIGFLKERPVWLKNPVEQKQSTLFDLYESYCDPRLRNLLFATKDEILISMDNETGPYHSLRQMRWFDRDLCSRFIYKRLLENRAQMRKFRLSLSIPIEARLDGNPFTNVKGSITQVSESGILVYFPYSASLKHWDKKEADIVFVKKPLPIDREGEVSLPEALKLQSWYHALGNFWIPLNRLQDLLQKGQLSPDEQSCYLFLPYNELKFFGLKERNYLQEIGQHLNEVKGILKKAS